MKLEDLPPQLRDAANAMQKLGGDAYATARKKFLDALAEHTGDVDKAKQAADDVLEQARTTSGDVFARARAKSEQLLKQAQAKSDELVQKAKEKLEKK
jgi:cell division septum initiation protein DivIVA